MPLADLLPETRVQSMTPRAIATQIIHQVCYEGISLSDAFDRAHLNKNKDVSFIKEICFGTIRFWLSLQSILKQLLEKPLKKTDKDIECLLCMGLYQLQYMFITEYAIVNETVETARALKKPWATGLVNKILRRMIAEKTQPIGITAQYAHPNWLIDNIKKAYPAEWESILQSNNEKAPLFLRVNTTKITAEQFQSVLSDNQISFISVAHLDNALLLPSPIPVEKIPGFHEGFFSVQDAAGQKVLEYLDLNDAHIVLDACAAPGSKTTHLLEKHPAIKKLISVDISESRLQKIKENTTRLQLNTKNHKLITADIEKIDNEFPNETFDRILLDAPCSATGVIRRHPDIKLLRKKTDISVLAAQQLKMLHTLWPLLKKRGKLLYTTCSILPDENSDVIKSFLSQQKDAHALPLDSAWGKPCEQGQQVITGDQGRDGFYYALLEKC
jgi:16S rRNA (cytosine967-C5)-methyltransferase